MRLMIWAIGPVALLIASTASAQNIEIKSLIDRFDAARIQHDPAALSKTLASDYEEISPVGEVDDRGKVLGFYAPELKRTAPAMTSEPLVIRSRGDVAIITTRKSFTIPGGPVRSVRVRYVAERAAGKWLLVSAQYTPIPPAKTG
ncbi:nuclear transport factor 2 family protein [Sphingomonas sanguinis]|mgnify:CR=1 FL=1|uniref:nuclear transport factor 2 family protein n=1 Tax=Sphingomonas sanguinis TaxID=33051 RepID=UPI001FD49DFE|nr:nuclear transport factor 2 family protein [Sphingomonas sanguinis]